MGTVRGARAALLKSTVSAVAAGSFVLLSAGTGSTAMAAPTPLDTGFNPTNAGVAKYLPFAPTRAGSPAQVNAPLGRKEADRLAATFGFDQRKALSKQQFAAFLSGKGVPPGYTEAEARKAAQLTRLSVTYLTNTSGNTYLRVINGQKVVVNLGSYGLIVSEDGMLKVPANCPDPTSPDFAECSPVRQINWVLAPDAVCANAEAAGEVPAGVPCGYMGAWLRHNKARDTLEGLYGSAYAKEAPYASKSQGAAGVAQLIYNEKSNGRKATVGVPVAPAMWVTNFMLVYTLSPKAAAKMPAYWEAIPKDVVTALEQSPNGQVPYSKYLQRFDHSS